MNLNTFFTKTRKRKKCHNEFLEKVNNWEELKIVSDSSTRETEETLTSMFKAMKLSGSGGGDDDDGDDDAAQLAHTGAETDGMLGVAGLAVTCGAVLLWLSRTRRSLR